MTGYCLFILGRMMSINAGVWSIKNLNFMMNQISVYLQEVIMVALHC